MDYKITNKAIDKLKYDLVREGLLNYNQLIDAIELSREEQTNLGQILIQNNIIKEEHLLNFLEQKLHIPYVNLDDYTIDEKTINLISYTEAKKHKIIPLFSIEDTLTIAMADPLDLFTLNNLNIGSNFKVEPVICSERTLLKAIENLYTQAESIQENEEISSKSHQKFNWQTELNEDNTDEVNIYKLIRAIIYQAIHEQASDIHFDPQKDKILIRFRIDGIMHNRGSLPILMSSNCISRIKSAAGLNLKEETLPQQGRMEVNIIKETLNTRVSTFPTNYGEKIVIKMFSKAPAISDLGFESFQLDTLKDALKKDSGMILSTGPLGSGQTTTMYSILELINNENKNIMTIESPIRYNIENINQTHLNTANNFDLKMALKTILLQEPDIIYIDELTDTADIELIIKFSLAGQLILSSIVADNAIGVLKKILSLGVDKQTIKAVINCVFNQKLIKKLCLDCKTPYKADKDILTKLGLPDNITYFKAQGCKKCNNTGYRERTGIFELVQIDNEVIEALYTNIPEDNLVTLLKSKGYKTLSDIALEKVKNGITSIEEIQRLLKI
ncbi:MAG: GspE/PulE family protein [Vampirovibrionia bacterium]